MINKHKHDLISGKRPVLEALRADVKIENVLVLSSLKNDEILDKIEKLCKSKNVDIKKVSRSEINNISKVNNQGCVAIAGDFEYASLDDVISRSERLCPSLVVVCDHITDVGNLGAIIRSAESVGALCVIVENARSAHVSPAVFKASAGAVCHIPVCRVANVARTLDSLKSNGFWVVGATQHSEELIWNSNLKDKIALVLGNEEKGISNCVLKSCDSTFKLPQRGEISSLNVAQASTVFMYEWVRQNELK